MKLEICLLSAVMALSASYGEATSTPMKVHKMIAPTVGQVVEERVVETVGLPTGYDNAFKAYMDYRCITDTSSEQYDMQLDAYTDENGLRKIGDYYCVAMGSGICSELGKKYEIELDSGQIIKVIQADQKADCHTDTSNRFIDLGNGRINIVEFIVSTEHLPDIVRTMGNIDHMPNDAFNGQIIEIREVES